MVSIGRSRASAAEISAPSPRTTIIGARMLARFQKTLAGANQPVDHRDQPGVQKCGQRPARAAEL